MLIADGIVSHGKVTPAVRKILQSQKTFANHLADFEALSTQTSSHPTTQHVPRGPPPTPVSRPAPSISTPNLTSAGKRSHKKKDPNAVATPTPLRQMSSSISTPIKPDPDTPMPDAHSSPSAVSLFQPSTEPVSHPGDHDPLLISRVPAMPSMEEIEKLWAEPPLSWNEARGPWVEEDRRKPIRMFCEVCGYWGRVKCTRCGGRVCALDCLQVHKEECFGRYGA
jgi:zinc finger HIT domain-containing protein 1